MRNSTRGWSFTPAPSILTYQDERFHRAKSRIGSTTPANGIRPTPATPIENGQIDGQPYRAFSSAITLARWSRCLERLKAPVSAGAFYYGPGIRPTLYGRTG